MILHLNLFLIICVSVISCYTILTATTGSSHSYVSNFDKFVSTKIGPKGMPHNKTTSCRTFQKSARFNPHSVVGIKWFVFYYWSHHLPITVYEFWIPNKAEMRFLHYCLDGHMPKHFNWSSTLVLMRNIVTNHTSLLEEKGDRGQYMSYAIFTDLRKGQLTKYKEMRFRQTGDNKYVAFMYCKERKAFVMSDIDKVPPKHKIQEEASKLGYRGRKGKSYLYQGHEWMPIPETDEEEFWFHHRKRKMMNVN